jgi:hypothetical protein
MSYCKICTFKEYVCENDEKLRRFYLEIYKSNILSKFSSASHDYLDQPDGELGAGIIH